jgi:hypothetical protein
MADAAGGSGTISVSINRECSWTARSDADWLKITSATTGQGDGTIAYSVAPNAVVTMRRANLVVNDSSLAVQQAAAACLYRLDRTERSFDPTGGSQTVSVSAQTGCSWTAVSRSSWVSVSGGASGNGDGTVRIVVDGNASAESRSGAVAIANQMLTIDQAGVPLTPTPPAPSPTPTPAPPEPTPTPTPPAPSPTPAPTPAPTPTPPAPAPTPTPTPTPTPPAPAPTPTPTPPAPTPTPPAPTPTPPAPTPDPTPTPTPPPQEQTLDGKVSALVGTCPLLTFDVDGREVHTLPTTVFSGGKCSDVKKNKQVTVKGTLQVGGFVLATRVTLDK